MKIIELKSVSKRYPGSDVNAVDRVNLSIEKGQFVVIVGASGSGKTTLLKMINRLIEPTEGEIFLNGENVMCTDASEYRRKIGYVIQQSGLFPHMTVRQNISVVPQIMKWKADKTERRVKELMDMIGMDFDEYANRFPRELSGGEQQRVGLARGLAIDPDVVLMDEPFGAVDAITRKRLQDEVLELQKRMHKTIVFVTHDISEAFKLGDRIIIMNQGKVQQYDSVFNILFHPANDYVGSLLSGENMLDKLQAVKASEIMEKSEALPEVNDINTVRENDSLKTVYQRFILYDISRIYVVRDNAPAGVIDKKSISALTRSILEKEAEERI